MRNKTFFLAPIAAAVLSACAVGPNYHEPETRVADRFEQAASPTYSVADGEASVSTFWTNFQDPTLESLVSQALVANHDLRIAATRVREARALRRDAAFDLAPSINVGGGYTKSRTANVTTQPGAPRL